MKNNFSTAIDRNRYRWKYKCKSEKYKIELLEVENLIAITEEQLYSKSYPLLPKEKILVRQKLRFLYIKRKSLMD